MKQDQIDDIILDFEHHEQADLLREKGWGFIEYDEYGQEVWGPPQF